jgi:hypothetical protein
MKELEPTKMRKSLMILTDDETLPELIDQEESHVMNLEELCRLCTQEQ